MFQIEKYAPERIASIALERFDDVIVEESSVGISRQKLKKIRKQKLTATQVDDLMDAAEARLAGGAKVLAKNSPGPDSVQEVTSKTEDLDAQIDEDVSINVLSQPPLEVLSFMKSLELLGKLLRNSEFTSRERKLKGVRLYTQNSAKFFLLVNELIADVFSKMVEAVNEDESVFDDEAIRGLHYFLTKKNDAFYRGPHG